MSENYKKMDKFSLIKNEKQKNIQRTSVNFSFGQNNIGKPLSTFQVDSESGLTINLLEMNLQVFSTQGKALTKQFYHRLFEKPPEVSSLFLNTTIDPPHKNYGMHGR